jgi:hypothetical protein
MSRFQVKKVAVLGAGVMGAQIAAHLVNVKVPVVLFDLPAKEGPKNGIVTKAGRRPEKTQALAAGRGRRCRADRPGQLRRAPGAAARLRPHHRGDCRAHGLEARPVQKIAPFVNPECHRRVQHLGPVDHQALRGAAREHQAALLRHPLLQPAALHDAGGADQHPHHRPRSARPARSLCDQRPGQGRGARARHAQLRGQPRRHCRHAGDHEGSRELRPDLRCGGRPHRQEAGPRFSGTFRTADVVGWTPWPTSSRRCRTT